MTSYLKTIIFFAFVCVYTTGVLAKYCEDNATFVIRTSTSDLVLDATIKQEIFIRNFTGVNSQLWRFECTDYPGRFYIYSITSEIQLAPIGRGPGGNYFELHVAYAATNPLAAQWYIDSNGVIINALSQTHIFVHSVTSETVVQVGSGRPDINKFVFLRS